MTGQGMAAPLMAQGGYPVYPAIYYPQGHHMPVPGVNHQLAAQLGHPAASQPPYDTKSPPPKNGGPPPAGRGQPSPKGGHQVYSSALVPQQPAGAADRHNKYCHFCRHQKVKKSSSMIGCSNLDCVRRFCGHCLRIHLGDPDPAPQLASKAEWFCPVCRRICCCALAFCSRDHRHCKTYRYRRRRGDKPDTQGSASSPTDSSHPANAVLMTYMDPHSQPQALSQDTTHAKSQQRQPQAKQQRPPRAMPVSAHPGHPSMHHPQLHHHHNPYQPHPQHAYYPGPVHGAHALPGAHGGHPGFPGGHGSYGGQGPDWGHLEMPENLEMCSNDPVYQDLRNPSLWLRPDGMGLTGFMSDAPGERGKAAQQTRYEHVNRSEDEKPSLASFEDQKYSHHGQHPNDGSQYLVDSKAGSQDLHFSAGTADFISGGGGLESGRLGSGSGAGSFRLNSREGSFNVVQGDGSLPSSDHDTPPADDPLSSASRLSYFSSGF